MSELTLSYLYWTSVLEKPFSQNRIWRPIIRSTITATYTDRNALKARPKLYVEVGNIGHWDFVSCDQWGDLWYAHFENRKNIFLEEFLPERCRRESPEASGRIIYSMVDNVQRKTSKRVAARGKTLGSPWEQRYACSFISRQTQHVVRLIRKVLPFTLPDLVLVDYFTRIFLEEKIPLSF